MKTIYDSGYIAMITALREARLAARLTQAQAARRVGMSRVWLGKVERRRSAPTCWPCTACAGPTAYRWHGSTGYLKTDVARRLTARGSVDQRRRSRSAGKGRGAGAPPPSSYVSARPKTRAAGSCSLKIVERRLNV